MNIKQILKSKGRWIGAGIGLIYRIYVYYKTLPGGIGGCTGTCDMGNISITGKIINAIRTAFSTHCLGSECFGLGPIYLTIFIIIVGFIIGYFIERMIRRK